MTKCTVTRLPPGTTTVRMILSRGHRALAETSERIRGTTARVTLYEQHAIRGGRYTLTVLCTHDRQATTQRFTVWL